MIDVNINTENNTIEILGLKDWACRLESGRLDVILMFTNGEDMKALQAALNRKFPENSNPYPEPKCGGLYVTRTGVVLDHDADTEEWSVPCLRNVGKTDDFEPVLFNWEPDFEPYVYADWGTVVARFGDEAFPLIPVYVTPR